MTVPTPTQCTEYETIAAQFASAIAGLSEQEMQRIQGDEWSIHEIVIHLADSEAIGFWRLRKTIAEPGSTLAVYDEALWAKQLAYNTQSTTLALQLFTALRASTAALLRSLPAETWQHTSIHPERGHMSLYDIFLLYLDHGMVHLQQIERLKQSLPTTA